MSIQAVYFNKDLALNAGDGNNGIQMFGSIFGTGTVSLTSAGGDNVQLGNNKGGTLSVITGDGGDSVGVGFQRPGSVIR